MAEGIRRELVYFWYYFSVQFNQIAFYWILGMGIGSILSVIGKQKLHGIFQSLQGRRLGVFGVIPASIIGIASPLCMYGTIPIAASFSERGMEDDWLAAFMMSSILLNPQLLIYSASLGRTALVVRIISSFVCGAIAGLLVRLFYHGISFFTFHGFGMPVNRDTDPNLFIRILKNFGRNIKATAGYFILGVALSALFQRYVPSEMIEGLFGGEKGMGVLLAATIGVPLYACGGGTIPLLMDWLNRGMSIGAAAAFMITGPATKITNLGAVKIILGMKQFVWYLIFVILFSLITGLVTNIVTVF